MRLIFAALVSIAYFASTMVLAAPDKFRIGVILPRSGAVASLGEYVHRGIILAQEQISEEVASRIEIINEDDQFDPKQTISAYRKISAGGPVDAVFVLASPTANALGPITEARGEILVAIGASDPGIVAGRKWSFIHWVVPSALGDRLAREIVRRDFKRIAFVTGEVTGAMADTAGAVEALAAQGYGDRIVYRETFDKGTTDYRSAITTLKAKRADLVVVVLFPGGVSSFVRQARDLGLEAEIAGMETFEDEAEVRAADGALLGKWYVNADEPSPEFVAAYRKRWGSDPGWASANGYDAFKLVVEAIPPAGTRREAVREALATLKDYRGAAGTYSATGDNRFLLPAALKRITTKGFERIETSAQEAIRVSSNVPMSGDSGSDQ